ncbi:hypothetical protein Theco_1960 [Thermobacillus composti KWC4]|uniref:Uncharacterized protein n=1 Tax=Thermobacillus composti (strain DSM 18247 / JCM 13945 / KWC4) TaxID=717605 RepID=L0EE40_THECK|nr:hypothetical protein [Thermobacillus composti]AGA58082.1 hypothetical protein Theco_1960 [Thermobacillus composti KWC4]
MIRIAVYTIAAAIVLLAIPVVASLGEYTRAKTMYDDDSRFIRELSVIALTADQFVMAEAADFEWDTLYIFGPYTTRKEMEEQIGTTWYNSYSDYLKRRTPFGRHPIEDDSLQKLVFVRDGKVVLDATVSRSIVDFTWMDKTRFSRAEARFELRHEHGWSTALWRGLLA